MDFRVHQEIKELKENPAKMANLGLGEVKAQKVHRGLLV